MTLEELYNTILSRKKEKPEGSYVAALFREGDDRIVQKIGEEAVEVVIAVKNKSRKRMISEVADLLFHLLILLASREIEPSEILLELKRRKICCSEMIKV
jgi:phosphoribosyl-ATP pyrophosphohydrolase